MIVLATILIITQVSGKVTAITDGDTISVTTADKTVKVRLVHIDTPEPGQAFSAKAKESLAGMVFGREVQVVGNKRDQYKRILGDVLVDGRSVNLRMVEEGFAWAYTEYRPPAPYSEAQNAARQARRGLWADRNPQPPWEYRREKRAKAAAKKKERAARRSIRPSWGDEISSPEATRSLNNVYDPSLSFGGSGIGPYCS